MARAGDIHRRAQVFPQQLFLRPDALVGRAAKAALVIGIGGHAMFGPIGGGHVEGVGIVVHPMNADDDIFRVIRALSGPDCETEAGAVLRDELVSFRDERGRDLSRGGERALGDRRGTRGDRDRQRRDHHRSKPEPGSRQQA